MTSETKTDLMRRGMEAFGQGDVATFRETMNENIVWHMPGTHPFAGDHRGRDAVIELLLEVRQRTGGAVEPMDILAGHDYVMVFTKFRSAMGDQTVEVMFADAVRFDADGLLTEYWSMPSDPEAWDVLLS